MFLRRLIFLFFFCIGSTIAFAQELDSLKRAAYSGPDTSRVDALTQLTKMFAADDPAQALVYGKEAIDAAEKLGDDRRMAWALNYMGSIYYYRSDYDSAFYYHHAALEIRLHIDDPKGLGASYNNIGMISDDLGRTQEALDYYLKAIEQFEKSHFDLGLAVVYSSIGNLYYYQHDFANAEKFNKKSLEMHMKMGNRRGIMNSYNNLALIEEENGDTTSALEMLQKAMRIAEEEGFTGTLVTSLNNIGQIYSSRKEVDKALPLFRRSVALCDSMEDEPKKISPLFNIGYCFRIVHKYDSALYYTNESLRLARKAGFLPSVKECYLQLSQISSELNDYEKAYQYRIYYEDVNDSVYNEEKSGQLTEMQTKYDTEKVMKDNQLKDERLQRQTRERWFYIIGAILVAIVALLIFLALRRTRKLNGLLNEQKAEILAKNHDLSRKNELIGEQKREITSSIEYAKNIQSAMLPAMSDFKRLFPSSFVFFRPRDIVSGDFYFVSGNEEHALLAVADCTGHGVPGALMSMIGMEKLRDAAGRSSVPGEMLSHLNRAVKSSLQQEGAEVQDGMDIVLCRLDRTTMRLAVAGANRPLWIIKNGVLAEYKTEKTAIGGITPVDYQFNTENILLESGDMIYLFSDGFADQFGGEGKGGGGKKFTIRRLRELLTGLSQLPVEEQFVGLQTAFDGWKDGLEQIDDVLVIGIRV